MFQSLKKVKRERERERERALTTYAMTALTSAWLRLKKLIEEHIAKRKGYRQMPSYLS